MPAWVQRDGVRMPLVPGMQLRAGDLIHTGAGSRLAVRMAEGSLVKLGENGRLHFTEISPSRQIFRAAIDVLQGAFRFTTELLGKGRRRDVSIRVSQVTAGIRGTDVWGRSVPGNEIVCLIEGAVEVRAAGERPLVMDQPLQFYRRVQGTTQPVGIVDAQMLARWAQETDIAAGQGAASAGGQWSVLAGTLDDPDSARALSDRLREAGYAAQVAPTAQGVYDVKIPHLVTQADAQALAQRLRGQHGVFEPSVTR